MRFHNTIYGITTTRSDEYLDLDYIEGQINFLLNHCELVLVTLDDITEAFQFFDAQNARRT